MIVNNRKSALIKATNTNVCKLWALLRKTDNWGSKYSKFNSCGNVDDVNNYFTLVVCDSTYSRQAALSELHSQLNADDANPAVKADYADFEIMVILSKVTKTATGCDDIPWWVYNECATELYYALSKLINFSINEGVVPRMWKPAIITHVPKTASISSVSDLRPISVTPVISRVVERLVVFDYLIPNVSQENLIDQ